MTTKHNRERLHREGSHADKTIAVLAVVCALIWTFWN